MTNTRISKIDDIENISLVLALSWKTAYQGIVHDEYLDKLRHDNWVEFLSTGLNNDTVFSMVIENNQEIIGAAILCNTEKEREVSLKAFYLVPDKIGQGFGHIFYNAIEIELKYRGFQNCVIDVLKENKRAIRFYEAHCFMDTGKKINAVLGEKNYICKVYEKALS